MVLKDVLAVGLGCESTESVRRGPPPCPPPHWSLPMAPGPWAREGFYNHRIAISSGNFSVLVEIFCARSAQGNPAAQRR